ncbi:MAG: hypothetical protein J4469_03585 [Candidatus Aenigmarchaeota archaeon]|nr:hypothetical protein [Candidatus Aenigmarchaeota archaeon]
MRYYPQPHSLQGLTSDSRLASQLHHAFKKGGCLERSFASPRSSEKRSFSEIPKSFGFREFQKAALFENVGSILERMGYALSPVPVPVPVNNSYRGRIITRDGR